MGQLDEKTKAVKGWITTESIFLSHVPETLEIKPPAGCRAHEHCRI